jgi:transposase
VDVREVLNAVFYVLSSRCQWSALPKDLPPKSTVWEDLSRRKRDGTIGWPPTSSATAAPPPPSSAWP